jgi:hypothetical protein
MEALVWEFEMERQQCLVLKTDVVSHASLNRRFDCLPVFEDAANLIDGTFETG